MQQVNREETLAGNGRIETFAGNLRNLTDRVRVMHRDLEEIGNRVFGQRPEGAQETSVPKPVAEGSLEELHEAFGEMGSWLEAMSDQVQRLKEL